MKFSVASTYFLFIMAVSNLILPGNSPAQNPVLADTVDVTFVVTVPIYTPIADTLFLYGTMNNWDPGSGQEPMESDLPLKRQADGTWTITITLNNLEQYEYNYTRGNLKTLENNADSAQRPGLRATRGAKSW